MLSLIHLEFYSMSSRFIVGASLLSKSFPYFYLLFDLLCIVVLDWDYQSGTNFSSLSLNEIISSKVILGITFWLELDDAKSWSDILVYLALFSFLKLEQNIWLVMFIFLVGVLKELIN